MAYWIKELDISAFEGEFDTDEKCLHFLAEEKWKAGYVCRSCGNENYCKGRKPYSRRCTRCKKEESATAHTLFHGCKISLPDAFKMAFRICNKPDISTYEMARQFDTRQMTCWKFKHKIMECIESKGELQLIDLP